MLFKTFEHIDMLMKSSSQYIYGCLLFIVHLLLLLTNLPPIIFLKSSCEQYITDPAQLLLAGDFNFHIDFSDKAAHRDFLELLSGFVQS